VTNLSHCLKNLDVEMYSNIILMFRGSLLRDLGCIMILLRCKQSPCGAQNSPRYVLDSTPPHETYLNMFDSAIDIRARFFSPRSSVSACRSPVRCCENCHGVCLWFVGEFVSAFRRVYNWERGRRSNAAAIESQSVLNIPRG